VIPVWLLPALARFAPWIVAAAGVAVGIGGIRGCASGLERRGELKSELAATITSLDAERRCEVRTTCAERALREAAEAAAAVQAQADAIRADNERRVASAVAAYARDAERAAVESKKWRDQYERQKVVDPSCAAWASQRVGCILRPLPASADRDEARSGDDAESVAPFDLPAVLSTDPAEPANE
jgi:hypothetical protein